MGALYRERRERRNQLHSLMCLLLHQTQYAALRMWRAGGSFVWLGFSLHFYVGPRDQTQPTVCWTQAPKSTSVLSERMGLFLLVCFCFFVERSLPASGFTLPLSLRPDLFNSWEPYIKDENQLPQVCPLTWKHMSVMFTSTHTSPNQSINQLIKMLQKITRISP